MKTCLLLSLLALVLLAAVVAATCINPLFGVIAAPTLLAIAAVIRAVRGTAP